MRRIRSLAPFVMLAGLSALSLGAQVPLGLSIGLATPRGEFTERGGGRPGFVLAVCSHQDDQDGSLLRPRVEVYDFHGQGALAPDPDLGRMDNHTRVVALGVDSVFYPLGSPKEGPYLVAGLGLACTTVTSVAPPHPTSDIKGWPWNGDLRQTANRAYYDLGFGHQLNSTWALEVRYFSTTWSGGGARLRIQTVSTSLCLRLP